jgi:TDP-D-fucosamine acetyltransferase
VTLPLKLLPWDSDHFGVRVARIETTEPGGYPPSDVEDWVAEHEVDCVYLLTDEAPAHTRWAARAGFNFVGTKLDFEIPAADAAPGAVRPGRAEDLAAFDELLRRGYAGSRFFFDERFARDAAESLYVGWLERSLVGAFDDATLVAEHDGQPAGFVTLRREEQTARIGLIGVSAASRRQGIAARLVEAARGWARAEGYAALRVATQGSNTAAARLYERAGGVLVSHQLWFHRWTESGS